MTVAWTWLAALAVWAACADAQICTISPDKWSMANNRPASQSSTWTQEGETLGAAGHAVDGNLEGDFYKGFCSHTNYDLGPWWTVDLGESRTIHTVVVKNRQDCCWKRLSGAEVRVGDSVTNNGTSNPLCGTIAETSAGSISIINCKSSTGRYVTITIAGRKDYLQLCEVAVYGVPLKVESCGIQQ